MMATVASETPTLTLFLSPKSTWDRLALAQLSGPVQELLFEELGIICPMIQIQDDEDLPAHAVQLQVNDSRPTTTRGPGPNGFWLDSLPSQPAAHDETGLPATQTDQATEAAIVPEGESVAQHWRERGYPELDPVAYLFYHLADTMRHNAGKLLSTELVRHYLTTLQPTYPALVDAALKQFDLAALTRILRDKLDGRSSIRNLPVILEDLLATDPPRSEEGQGLGA
jgi:flagellar biosynthesis component FlhA